MFKKVLAALDLSDASEAVFESALELAIATHSQLMLLHTLVAEHNGGPALPVSAPWDYYADERVDELAASNL
ncbi:hypothetical protein BH23CYA1_BH23CYA1_20280 [soil metagenome]